MTNLKEVNFGVNTYCGPSVLSALTGRNTDECASVISDITGRSVIKAVEVKYLIEAFKRLRFDCVAVVAGRSLYGTLMRLLPQGDGMYIIIVPHHVVAVEVKERSCYLVDNASKKPLNASASARLMQHVDAVYRVTKKVEPVFIEDRYTATYFGGRQIILWCESIYQNSEDNIKRRIGSIECTDMKTFYQISSAIVRLADEKVSQEPIVD